MSVPYKDKYLPAMPGSRRVKRIKNPVIVGSVVLFIVLVWFVFGGPDHDDLSRPSDPDTTATASILNEIPEADKKFPTLKVDNEKESVAQAAHEIPHLKLATGQSQSPLTGHGYQAAGKASSKPPAEEKFSQRPGFDAALEKIMALLPSELESRGLLRPIEQTGEQHLRELGMLARKYKRYYEAWEDLHVVTDAEGATHVRDDVIQYLRSKASSADVADLADEHNVLVDKMHAYEDFRRLLVKLNELLFPFTAPYFPDHMTLRTHLKKGGRGIVLTAGNDQVAYLLTQIPILRSLGCDLPIEVMYVGDNDLNRDSRQDLEDLEGVITRDIGAMIHTTGWDVASWAAKPFAILLSSFRETIFIDADSFFFVNPAVMFDYPEYEKTGALFFRDRLIMPETKKSWLQSILPQPVSRNVKQSRLWKGQSGHQQESGVLVVDTYRHFMAMMFVLRMNGPDRDGKPEEGKVGVYDMVYGDKETFWLGFELVGDTDYVFHQGDAGIIGELEPTPEPPSTAKRAEQVPFTADGDSDDADSESDNDPPTLNGTDADLVDLPHPKICSPQLLHLDLNGKPLWFNGGLVRNKFLDRREWKFGTWDTYLIEPREIREPGAWFLGDANVCCLTSDSHLKGELSRQDKGLLDAMVAQAKKVGIANY